MKKGILNFEFKAWWTIAHHKICQTIGDDVLSLFLSVMIAYFTLRYTFDVGEFLAQELRDRVVLEQKALLDYP